MDVCAGLMREFLTIEPGVTVDALDAGVNGGGVSAWFNEE
ncbi:MAG: hypothetical protein HBSAPP04_04960 [Ignavibacteriaceae bacterium]|nr:MAG: hypothetical protein HBSAPP04_04960 [Ignavibacteriaceae bacterium]